MTSTLSLAEFNAGFHDEPGYLDFARFGPISDPVLQEHAVQSELLSTARFGSIDLVFNQDNRVRAAVGGLLDLPDDQVAFQPNTSMGLIHALFGMGGVVAMSAAEFPSLTYAASRAADALGRLSVRWLQPENGRITPGTLRSQLDDDVTAVAVSLVDFRTGYVADLEGIRQVIGDRLLLVDAVQGFTVVDAAWRVADVIVSGGQKWVRAGHGTGFLALSERAADQLVPVLSGWMASSRAQAGFAAALEAVAGVGVATIADAIASRVDEVIALADEFAVAVTSPREHTERAGIVVLDAGAENATVLAAALFNHGVTVTTRGGTARVSVHTSTDDDTVSLLRTALTSYRTAAS